MITTDIYGKTFSSTFDSKIVSASQRIKPKIVVNWLESRNLTNLTASVDVPNQHSSSGSTDLGGDIGYYFTADQAANGFERQSFTWAVADAKDVDGNVIRADGTWYAMPSDLDDNYEFGWWSGTVSNTSVDGTYGGYGFADNPTLTLQFDDMKCNHIRVTTSEYYGQIHTYRMTVRSNDSGVANPLYSEVITVPAGSYFYEHYLPSSLGHSTIDRVELEVLTVRNPADYARVQEINTIYKTDVTDDIVDFTWDKTRDLHETELPIAGSSSGSVSLNFDNNNKDYNVFSSSSLYGQYMKKNVKVETSIGWQIVKSDDLYLDKTLSTGVSASDTTFVLHNTDDLPDGGAGDYYVMVVDPDSYKREYILVESKDDTYTLTINQRGYAGTIARSHNAGVTVRFETYEYVNYTESYVDEWNASSQSMTVGASTSDWTKFASENIITDGFFLDKATVADAVHNLLMKTNFPKSKFKSLNRFERSALNKDAILHMDFSELVADRSGTVLPVNNGLRARFFAMPSENFNKVKDIIADALDRELTQLEKALGDSAFTAPDYTVNTSDINYTATSALDLVDFTFTDINGETISTYYNGVFDGYYTPVDSGSQYIGVSIAHGGVRVYLDDTLVLESWQVNTVAAGQYVDLVSEELNLIAGKPYKIRIEFFHINSTNGVDDFSIYLSYAIGAGSLQVVPLENCYTAAAIDKIGSKDASYTPAAQDRNHNRNNGVYLGGVSVGNTGGIISDPDNMSVYFDGTSYMRLPYDLSWDLNDSSSENYTGEWSIEFYVKPASAGFTGDGDYISSFDSGSTPTGGFEFFNTSSSNGFKIETSSGIESVSTSGALSNSVWTHVVVTYDGTYIKYFLNGVLKDTLTVVGTISSWDNLDIGFGGRNAYYSIGSGEVAPASLRSFYIDHFLVYNKFLSDSVVADRYTECVMQPLTIYPFLYGNEASVRDIIEEITLADLGRFYIDELNDARYEHFYAFFEPSIDQHANTQITISDDSHILNADYNVQLQANKVVVKVSGLSTQQSKVQPLWRADDPTTLAVVNLENSLTANATSMTVSTTVDPPFFRSGYLVIDNEIIKYSSKNQNTFDNLERGLFGTTATSHTSGTPVREVRYWDLKYDNAPAFEVRYPFITGIQFESPSQIDVLQFKPDSYGAELIIAASVNVDKGTFAFAEGTDPLTERVAFTSIAGRPVVVTDQGSQVKEQVANLSENIRLYGLKEVVIENRFITDFDHAQKIADFIISKMTAPAPVLNISTLLTPKVQVGDRIKISALDSFDIINGEYWVVSKDYSYSGNPSQRMMLRRVV